VGELAHRIATDLDRAAFDPSWEPTDADADDVHRALTELERRVRTGPGRSMVSASS
jgi:hypothetical protein